MKKLLIVLCLTLATGTAFAKDEKAPTPQQERMQNCNKDAKTKALKGDERKKFMSECLSSKPAPAAAAATPATPASPATPVAPAEPKKAVTPQQQKMKDCNKSAAEKALKGDERKKFMSECLSNKPAETKK